MVSFAILAGFGLTSIFGIKLSPLAGSVVPFLTLGLGEMLHFKLPLMLSSKIFFVSNKNTMIT